MARRKDALVLRKTEFVERLATHGYTKKAASVIYDDFIDVIREALVQGDEVQFFGFGRFYVHEFKDREIKNITDQKPIIIKGYRYPKFQPSDQLKNEVKEGEMK